MKDVRKGALARGAVFVAGAVLALGPVLPCEASLVAWWPLDTGAMDASGNGHDGTLVGSGVTFGGAGANAATGTSASFTGAGHIDIPWDPALNTQSFSVTLWANPTAAGGGAYRSPITNRDDVAPGGAFRHGWIIYNNNNGQWSFWNGGGAGANGGWNVADAAPVLTNEWHHVGITYDALTNTKVFYLDGLAVSTTNPVAFSPNDGTSPDANPAWTYENEDLHIGGGGDTGTSFRWEGAIDDVAVFNSALSQSQIQNIMMNGVPEPGAPVLLGIATLGLLLRRR